MTNSPECAYIKFMSREINAIHLRSTINNFVHCITINLIQSNTPGIFHCSICDDTILPSNETEYDQYLIMLFTKKYLPSQDATSRLIFRSINLYV